MWLAAIFFIILLGTFLKLYIKLSTRWCKSHKCLVGKTVIVTGANAGIGFDTALDFAKRGARVILACRDKTRADNARAKIIEETDNPNVVVELVDLASFNSVRAFAKRIVETQDRLDILVNNAGVGVGVGDERTGEGHVLTMQINYFSPFLLTLLLLGLLKKTKGSRIVNVSSMAAMLSYNLDPKNIDKFPGYYKVYGYSKLSNILFTMELAKKLEGTGVTTYSLHPGAVKTEILRSEKGLEKIFLSVMMNVFFKTSEEGAQTTIYCALEKGLEVYNGEHFDNCRKVAPYKPATVPGISKKLWEVTEEIVQLKPEEKYF